MSAQTIVLSGAGPRIKVTSTNGKPVNILVLSKNSVKKLEISETADVKFAA